MKLSVQSTSHSAIQRYGFNSRFDTLDAIADRMEEILSRCGIPGQVRGGYLRTNGIEMEMKWHCDPTRYDACCAVKAAIRQTFNCRGGVDASQHTVWLFAEK